MDFGRKRNVHDRPARRLRRGFTLIEVLVVVVIAAITATIALPGFVRSMRGAQLRTASRTVIMAHKYARSAAVLRQVPMAVLLDSVAREVEIVALEPAAGGADRSRFLDTRATRAVDAVVGGDQAMEVDAPSPSIQSELVRFLGRDIVIDQFRSERGGQEFEGVYWITYHPNGMSDGFDLVLTDGSTRAAHIRSDSISGRVEARFDRF